MVMTEKDQNKPVSPTTMGEYRITEQERHIEEVRARQREEMEDEKAILYYLRHETFKYLW